MKGATPWTCTNGGGVDNYVMVADQKALQSDLLANVG